MKIVIIEDERLTADDLAETLLQLDSSIGIGAKLRSVKESILYLQTHPEPDLIFSDIQLGDGVSFEIFAAVRLKAPVIFLTAFHEYAVSTFTASRVDYLFKPFTSEMVRSALQRFHLQPQAVEDRINFQYELFLKLFVSHSQQQKLYPSYATRFFPCGYYTFSLLNTSTNHI